MTVPTEADKPGTPAHRDPRQLSIPGGELAWLKEQAAQAREELAGLQHQIDEAEIRLSGVQPQHIVEVNERLVTTALQAQIDAATAADKLQQVLRLAELDALTGLPNRVLMRDRLEHAIENAKRHGAGFALLFVDQDNFKQINDSLGHAVGDEALKLAAHALASVVRDADTVCRHGGDEFVVLLEEVEQPPDAMAVADKLIATLRGPHHVGQRSFCLTASIGISHYPEHGQDAATLIDHADAAMYRAKRQGLGGVVVHDDALSNDEPLASAREAQQSARHQLELDGHEQRHAQQREANAQMVDGHGRALAAHERQHTQDKQANTQLGSHHERDLASLECQQAQQQEANEHLLLAALGAQERQADAELAQRRQTKFLAMIAHELRNPLAPISNAAALLGNLPPAELLPRLQAVIERQVAHLSRLVGDLLDVSRASSGKLRLECEAVDLVGLVTEAVDARRPAMIVRNQRFTAQVPAGPMLINGDPVRLVQVLSNLLDNASKYTPVGGDISLSTQRVGSDVQLTVTDSGIGITADALPHVFDAFVQDPHAIGFNGAGLGIGLTVVRELVEAHGGTVVAQSAGSGLGSQFVVTLPLIRLAS